jgi:hypothetical protein
MGIAAQFDSINIFVRLQLNFIFALPQESKLIKSFDNANATGNNFPLLGVEFNFKDNRSFEHKIRQ